MKIFHSIFPEMHIHSPFIDSVNIQIDIQRLMSQIAIRFANTDIVECFPSLFASTVGGYVEGGGDLEFHVTSNKIVLFGAITTAEDAGEPPRGRMRQFKLVITWDQRLYEILIERFHGHQSSCFPIIKGFSANFMQIESLGPVSLIVISEVARPRYDCEVLSEIHEGIRNQFTEERELHLSALFLSYLRCLQSLHEYDSVYNFPLCFGFVGINDIFLPPTKHGEVDAKVSLSWDALCVGYLDLPDKLYDLRYAIMVLIALLLQDPFYIDERRENRDILGALQDAVQRRLVSETALHFLQVALQVVQQEESIEFTRYPVEVVLSHPWLQRNSV